MSSRFLVRQGSGRLGGNDEEPPSPVAVAQCNFIVNLIMGAVWLGLWLGYGKAENCDKELQLWYDLVLGGVLFGLACDVGVVIAAKRESKGALKMCKILHNLDQLFELGVMLWGVALAWGKESDRIGAGGCKVLATWQKVNATTILVLASLAMCAIMTGGGEDAEKSTESYVATEMVQNSKRMRARQELEERVRDSHRVERRPPSPFIDPDYQV